MPSYGRQGPEAVSQKRLAAGQKRPHETDHWDADDQSTGAQGPRGPCVEEQGACAQAEPAEARRLHTRVYDDAEETELRAAQGRESPPYQWLRGDQLYRRRRPQLAGTLGGPDSRRPREGSAGRALSHGARQPGHGGRQGSQAGPFEVWRQEAQSCLTPARKLSR